MLKNTLITLMLGTASMCGAMELAQKHLAEIQKQRDAGMADNLQLIEARIAYLGAERLLNADTMTEEEAQKSSDEITGLMRQAYTLAKARYEQGLCSYKKVLDVQYELRCEEAALLKSSPSEVMDELKKIHREYESFIEKHMQAGMVDAAEKLEWKRTLLMKQLFNNTVYAAQSAALQKEIEQNFDEAKKLIQRRYHEGLASYDELENINNQEIKFRLNLRMWNMVMRSRTTDEQLQELYRQHADALKQAYEDVANTPTVSPYTKLLRRVDYLLAEKTVEKYESRNAE